MHDLLIAGGGPTGLGAAIMAAQAGLQTTVFEPNEGVIDKACGEGLMPGAVAFLETLGVRPATAHPCGGALHRVRRAAQGKFPTGPGLGVRRTVLHQALFERAKALGVSFRRERAGTIDQDESMVRVNGLEARYLFAADGLYSSIRKQLGVAQPARYSPRYGLRRHYQQAPWSDFVEVYWTDDAEAYVTPVAPNLIGVAVLFGGEPLPPGQGSEQRYNQVLARFRSS